MCALAISFLTLSPELFFCSCTKVKVTTACGGGSGSLILGIMLREKYLTPLPILQYLAFFGDHFEKSSFCF